MGISNRVHDRMELGAMVVVAIVGSPLWILMGLFYVIGWITEKTLSLFGVRA